MKRGLLIGFWPLDRDKVNVKDDVHDENYPIHPTTLNF